MSQGTTIASLPLELLSLGIQLAARDDDSLFYLDPRPKYRQLRALSLVARDWRELAQTHLWRFVSVTIDLQASAFSHTPTNKRRYTQGLRIIGRGIGTGRTWHCLGAVRDFLTLVPNLRALDLISCLQLDRLLATPSLSGLTDLCCYNTAFANIPTSIPFRLTALEIGKSFSPHLILPLFEASSTSLRHLHLWPDHSPTLQLALSHLHLLSPNLLSLSITSYEPFTFIPDRYLALKYLELGSVGVQGVLGTISALAAPLHELCLSNVGREELDAVVGLKDSAGLRGLQVLRIREWVHEEEQEGDEPLAWEGVRLVWEREVDNDGALL